MGLMSLCVSQYFSVPRVIRFCGSALGSWRLAFYLYQTMSFQVYKPSERLKPFIRSFVIEENEDSRTYKILPDTSVVMGFQYSGRLSLKATDKNILLHEAGVSGLADSFKIFSNTENTNTLLVMFTETGAVSFFKIPMHELFRESIALADILLDAQLDFITEKLAHAKNNPARIGAIETFLWERLHNSQEDKLVSAAVDMIRRSRGDIKITVLCEQLNISQSRFEKRFRAAVGASPKKFASIVRFKNVISSSNQDSLTQLGLEAGYFDQAHFIKDFKQFTGETPENFFRKK
jgi:AraC-like DNA-binding protein